MGSGLQLDQAPPLSIPAAFFLVAPVSVVTAGLLLLLQADQVLVSVWRPTTVALTHLGTLGLLAAVMLGALYQMTPVVAGRPVPAARLAHLVLAPFVLGVAALVAGLALGTAGLLHVAVVSLGFALTLFLLQVGAAMLRPGAGDDSVTGMRLALAALGGVALLGLLQAHGRATGLLPPDRVAMLQLHVTLGLLGWVGGLITAVSWKVLPMFYLAPELSGRVRRLVLLLLLSGLAAPTLWFVLGEPTTTQLALVAAPAAVAVWLLQPTLLLRSLSRRRRKRVDASLQAWQVGLWLAPPTALLAAAAVWGSDPRWALAFGWLAIWGQAGLVMHGMLTRILPFLVWYHRFSSRVGHAWVPTMKELLPDRIARQGLGVHLLSALLGLLAIATTSRLLTIVTGVSLLITGLALLRTQLYVLRRATTPPESRQAV